MYIDRKNFKFTMKIQLFTIIVKLRIDQHIIVIPREKDKTATKKTTCTTTPTASKLKHFSSFLRNMKLDLIKTNAHCSHKVNNGFL